MKLYYDFEFTGLHQGTTPISLGIVDENNRAFYAEFTDYDKDQIDPWLEEHVLANLTISKGIVFKSPLIQQVVGTKKKIAGYLLNWLAEYDSVQMVGDCQGYDQVLLCELFGGAMNLPKKINYIFLDLATMLFDHGIDPDISRVEFGGLKSTPHFALDDALVLQACHKRIQVECGSKVLQVQGKVTRPGIPVFDRQGNPLGMLLSDSPLMTAKPEVGFCCKYKEDFLQGLRSDDVLAKAEQMAREFHLKREEMRQDIAWVLNGRKSTLPYYGFDHMAQAERWAWVEAFKSMILTHLVLQQENPAPSAPADLKSFVEAEAARLYRKQVVESLIASGHLSKDWAELAAKGALYVVE